MSEPQAKRALRYPMKSMGSGKRDNKQDMLYIKIFTPKRSEDIYSLDNMFETKVANHFLNDFLSTFGQLLVDFLVDPGGRCWTTFGRPGGSFSDDVWSTWGIVFGRRLVDLGNRFWTRFG